jgi:DNA-binding PadR family transcriptional regulator
MWGEVGVQKADYKELNPLELFLLTFVAFGLTTPYDLQSKAGLGPGLTSPSLKRLSEAGLLASTSGPRKRLQYRLTKLGYTTLRRTLEDSKVDYWQVGQTDAYWSLPRAMVLAWLFADITEARRGVTRAISNLVLLSFKREHDAKVLHDSMLRMQAEIDSGDRAADPGKLVGVVYQWLSAEAAARLFTVQAQLAKEVAVLLKQLPPAPRVDLEELHSKR